MFQRFFDEGLAQASFLVGCDRAKQAVVIDPRRDATVYATAARHLGAAIVAAIETHVHADFVSGARELGDTGARVYAGPGAELADIPETPSYFARMKQVNKAGPPPMPLNAGRRLPSIRPAAAAALAADGALILDLRNAAAFAAGHPGGALNLAFGAKVGYWAGWVVPPDAPLVLLADEPAQAQEAALQLLRVGLDRIEGTIAGGFSAWTGAGLPVAQIEQIAAEELRGEATRAGGGAIRI